MITETNRPLEKLMENSYIGLKKILTADTVLGSPIVTNDGISIIPVCKITAGFLTGGGEFFNNTYSEYPIAGGTGTGMSVNPIGFLVCDKSHVKMIGIEDKGIVDNLIKTVPDIIKSLVNKDEKENNC